MTDVSIPEFMPDVIVPDALLEWVRRSAAALGETMDAEDARTHALLVGSTYILHASLKEPDGASHFDVAYVAAGDMAMAIDVHVEPRWFMPLVPWALGEGRAEVAALLNRAIDVVAAQDGTERKAAIAYLPIRPAGGSA